MGKTEHKVAWVVVAKEHAVTRFNPQEQKEVPMTLYHAKRGASLLSYDVLWLQGAGREESGTFFTTDLDKAEKHGTEEEADERATMLIMQDGFLPDDFEVRSVDLDKKDDE